MKKIFCFITSVIVCAVMLCVPVYAADKASAVVIDDADAFSDEDERTISHEAANAAYETGFNIVIFTSDNVGSDKSDAAVTDFADLKYEEIFGMNTDGILLFINFDNKYDRISTSGVCINYFSDYRIDCMWDDMDPFFDKDDYTGVALSFIADVENYYNAGKANHQTEILGGEFDAEYMLESFFSTFMFTGFAALIIAISLYFYYSKNYKIEKPETRAYTLKDSLYFTVRTDTFVGNVTNRIYSPRSSSSSGGSHHSGHSSTHHSSSGGRHGGGGHHR